MNFEEIPEVIENLVNKFSYIIANDTFMFDQNEKDLIGMLVIPSLLAYHRIFSDPVMISEIAMKMDDANKHFSFMSEAGDVMLEAINKYETYKGEEITKHD